MLNSNANNNFATILKYQIVNGEGEEKIIEADKSDMKSVTICRIVGLNNSKPC